MKRLRLVPSGWPCTLRECPPGLFVHGDAVGLKTEYGAMETVGPTDVPGNQIRWVVGRGVDVYCGDSGERFWGGTDSDEAVAALMVQPLEVRWEDVD